MNLVVNCARQPAYRPLQEEHGMYRPLNRHPVNKARSARSFRKQTRKTKAANLNGLARGGWRL